MPATGIVPELAIAALPDDEDNAAPADEDKKQPPQQDEQLHKAIQVLKSKTS